MVGVIGIMGCAGIIIGLASLAIAAGSTAYSIAENESAKSNAEKTRKNQADKAEIDTRAQMLRTKQAAEEVAREKGTEVMRELAMARHIENETRQVETRERNRRAMGDPEMPALPAEVV